MRRMKDIILEMETMGIIVIIATVTKDVEDRGHRGDTMVIAGKER